MHPEDDDDAGECFDCGSPAPWIIRITGEDEQPREAWACETHARGHWKRALVTPPAEESETHVYMWHAW